MANKILTWILKKCKYKLSTNPVALDVKFAHECVQFW